MNIIKDSKYGNTINSEMFGCTFFLISSYSKKYKMIEYSLFSAPTFVNGSVDWDRKVSITEWDTDNFVEEQHKEIIDCWQALMKEVV
tara:strand:- start:306 stop:566 length:261 start_codon:yes stop_codon:yes gene_type:complete